MEPDKVRETPNLDFVPTEDLLREALSRCGDQEEMVQTLLSLLQEKVTAMVAVVIMGTSEEIVGKGSPSMFRGMALGLLEQANIVYSQSRNHE